MTTPPPPPPGGPYQGPPPQQPGQPYGAPGQPYGAPQPAYNAPGYGAPGYGAPPPPPAGPARPGMITAAAVLAFIWGGFSIIGSLGSLAVGGIASSVGTACSQLEDELGLCNEVASAGGFLIFIGIVLIVAAALLIWGGVVALTGKDSRIAVIAGALLILLNIISVISSDMNVAFTIFGIAVPVLIVVFLMVASSKAWFQAKGGKTF